MDYERHRIHSVSIPFVSFPRIPAHFIRATRLSPANARESGGQPVRGARATDFLGGEALTRRRVDLEQQPDQ